MNASFDASPLSAFAGLSLLLAGAGLFGVLPYIVAQRTSEIDIRIALGSAVSAGITQFDSIHPYDSTALDPPVFAAVAALLL